MYFRRNHYINETKKWQHIIKIVIASNTSWSIYNFRKGLINYLIKSGFEVIVVAPTDAYSEKLRDLGCKLEHIPIYSGSINPFKDIYLFWKIRLIYKRIKPSLVIHYTIKLNIYGTIAAKISSLKSIAVTTGLGYTFTKRNWITYTAKSLYKLALRHANEVWFLNRDDRETFISEGIINEQRTKLLHSEGVDTKFFSPIKSNLIDENIRFLLISRMLWDKGIAEFVQAARLLRKSYPNAIFQLLGPCQEANPSAISRDEIAQWESDGSIEYLGVTDDVRSYIANADCVVLPSFYREGVPRVLMEAASMEKPIITTDNVGCRDVVIDNVTGFLCQIKNPNQLAACCLKLIDMTPSERMRMGAAARDMVRKNFDEEIIINQYIDLLRRQKIIQ